MAKMAKKTVAVIGGTQKTEYEKQAAARGLELVHHDGKLCNKSNPMKKLEPLVRKADYIVVMLGACHHETVKMLKKINQDYGKDILFQPGRGGSSAFEKAAQEMEQIA